MLESLAGVPVMGVIPFIDDIGIDEEDSVSFDELRYRVPNQKDPDGCMKIAVVKLPHISNFTDVDPLFLEPDVHTFFATAPHQLDGVSAIILPGSKNTMDDAFWLFETGLGQAIQRATSRGVSIFGICGGYQMLGVSIVDPHQVESARMQSDGLALVDIETTLLEKKETRMVQGKLTGLYESITVEGYEIHMGVTKLNGETPFATFVDARTHVERMDGVIASDGRVIGTYLHGIFHNDKFRMSWLNELRRGAGLAARNETVSIQDYREDAYERLADIVRANVDEQFLRGLMETW